MYTRARSRWSGETGEGDEEKLSDRPRPVELMVMSSMPAEPRRQGVRISAVTPPWSDRFPARGSQADPTTCPTRANDVCCPWDDRGQRPCDCGEHDQEGDELEREVAGVEARKTRSRNAVSAIRSSAPSSRPRVGQATGRHLIAAAQHRADRTDARRATPAALPEAPLPRPASGAAPPPATTRAGSLR